MFLVKFQVLSSRTYENVENSAGRYLWGGPNSGLAYVDSYLATGSQFVSLNQPGHYFLLITGKRAHCIRVILLHPYLRCRKYTGIRQTDCNVSGRKIPINGLLIIHSFSRILNKLSSKPGTNRALRILAPQRTKPSLSVLGSQFQKPREYGIRAV